MHIQYCFTGLLLFVLGSGAAPTQGFVPAIGPFGLRVTSADSSMENKYLVPTVDSNSTSVLAFSELPDRSFYWVPNSANPVPPGGQLAQGTILYEVKFHTRAYNLTLDLASFNGTENLYTPVILRNESEAGTPFAHSATYSKPGVIFLNDTSEFLGCRSGSPTDETITLQWQTNSEPGHQGQIDHKCSTVIIGMHD
ncbi:hypothetical protein H072_2974 [Dactylellina haptotyla CBS 200.50]|uniref:Ubiquitin 3 binding protein But2 C-terminal domain-containing protein n=1 Tax=Dactylellina haptotyla (strain CBS 200.50) TaxID=1284197 RepID=S8BU83_DACHA|nr:hypothetical protein H072_2974 [Dactylellina haptotyla CBS 200.50]